MNATGADYLLLTLLWGTRRGEAAPLRWFDRCSPGELRQSEVSWVWLAAPDEVNPYTRRAGSQVYLFDTKNGEERYLPVAYFAEKILQRRFDERADETKLRQDLADAEEVLGAARARRARRDLLDRLEKEAERARRALAKIMFVFPARSIIAGRKSWHRCSCQRPHGRACQPPQSTGPRLACRHCCRRAAPTPTRANPATSCASAATMAAAVPSRWRPRPRCVQVRGC